MIVTQMLFLYLFQLSGRFRKSSPI